MKIKHIVVLKKMKMYLITKLTAFCILIGETDDPERFLYMSLTRWQNGLANAPFFGLARFRCASTLDRMKNLTSGSTWRRHCKTEFMKQVLPRLSRPTSYCHMSIAVSWWCTATLLFLECAGEHPSWLFNAVVSVLKWELLLPVVDSLLRAGKRPSSAFENVGGCGVMILYGCSWSAL